MTAAQAVILASDDRDKLCRLLAMLTSDYDGEVINAARAAARIITRIGLTWDQTIPERVTPPPPAPDEPEQNDYRHDDYYSPPWRVDLAECIKREHALSDWERNFLHSIAHRSSLTPKQAGVFDRIKGKLRVGRQ